MARKPWTNMLAGMLNLLFWSSIWNTYIHSGAHLTTATFFTRLWVLPTIVSVNIYSSSGHELYISLSIYSKGIFILQLEDLMCSSAILLSLGNHENSKCSIHITSTTMFIHKYFWWSHCHAVLKYFGLEPSLIALWLIWGHTLVFLTYL